MLPDATSEIFIKDLGILFATLGTVGSAVLSAASYGLGRIFDKSSAVADDILDILEDNAAQENAFAVAGAPSSDTGTFYRSGGANSPRPTTQHIPM